MDNKVTKQKQTSEKERERGLRQRENADHSTISFPLMGVVGD